MACAFRHVIGIRNAALYFQYGLGLKPCIMCIYQRTAMYGIVLSALIVVIKNNGFTRMLGFAGWAVSAGWGFLIAKEHVGILNAANPFLPAVKLCQTSLLGYNFTSGYPLYLLLKVTV